MNGYTYENYYIVRKNKRTLHQEDADTTSASPTEKSNPPDQYSFTDTLKMSDNMHEMQHQSDPMKANTLDQVKAYDQEYTNVLMY